MVHPLYTGMPPTIFDEMSGLARAHGALNLGQGFPDDPGPEALRRAAAEAVLHGYNQYPPSRGLPELRRAIAAHYDRTQGLSFDPDTQVTVTSGATEALASAILALVEPGDEVILFQPAYDAYAPLVRRAGGVPRFVTLAPPDWRWTAGQLEAAFTPRTRAVILNTPVNPTGVVVPQEDLELLAAACRARSIPVICDEVWEQLVFDGAVHRPLIALPGMADLAVKIGSAGKMFGLTGWKVGFLCAGPALSPALARAHQFLTFTTPPNLQTAVAYGLNEMRGWFTDMPNQMGRSRDHLAASLTKQGFAVLPSQATYFLNVDLAASGIAMSDRDFCLRCVIDHGVAAIPLSALYEQDPKTSLIRLCFAKPDETLDEGARRLGAARAALA